MPRRSSIPAAQRLATWALTASAPISSSACRSSMVTMYMWPSAPRAPLREPAPTWATDRLTPLRHPALPASEPHGCGCGQRLLWHVDSAGTGSTLGRSVTNRQRYFKFDTALRLAHSVFCVQWSAASLTSNPVGRLPPPALTAPHAGIRTTAPRVRLSSGHAVAAGPSVSGSAGRSFCALSHRPVVSGLLRSTDLARLAP